MSTRFEPWEFEKSDGEYYNLQHRVIFKDDTGEPIICGLTGKPMEGHPMVQLKTLKGWAPREEQAKLIEAAPDLFNSMSDFVEWYESKDPEPNPNDFDIYFSAMKKALKKAANIKEEN